MELDIVTLFVADICVLVISAIAYTGIFLRHRDDHYWLLWIGANLVLASGLVVYVFWPDVPPHLAMIGDALLIMGFALRLAAVRSFGGRRTRIVSSLATLLAIGTIVAAASTYSVGFTLVNITLTVQSLLIAYEFWRDRHDRLSSRYGLVAAYILMATSFATRAGQGLFLPEQIITYIPYDPVLEFHLLIALIHVTAGSMLVLSLASERSAQSLEAAANRDPLTGLFNRRAFEAQLRKCVSQDAVSIILVDIDRFKAINDRYGHAAGDAVLRKVSVVFSHVVGTHGHIARVGGEEFAVVLAAVRNHETLIIAERLRQAIEAEAVPFGPHTIRVTASLGIAHMPQAGGDPMELFKVADRALYRAKASGRNACILDGSGSLSTTIEKRNWRSQQVNRRASVPLHLL
ncbi:diguanylate cyclase [Pelagibacterium sp. H642]|uniref:GGDEF domain-containing protein n=1 Tax=Pelagibacterium sp. H642 TaxID=1881069 RepID=UPI00281531F7|nr:diguanylate cyclase [Pelagibacterium sp. H642]WMT92915.1 diguanylate cyclase [Pelagibacterium sp. H642]